jgi:hypothetical protein
VYAEGVADASIQAAKKIAAEVRDWPGELAVPDGSADQQRV